MSGRQVALWAVIAFFVGIALGQLAYEYGSWDYRRTNAEKFEYLAEKGFPVEERQNIFADFWRAVLPLETESE